MELAKTERSRSPTELETVKVQLETWREKERKIFFSLMRIFSHREGMLEKGLIEKHEEKNLEFFIPRFRNAAAGCLTLTLAG